MSKFLIAGLGNIGREYEGTRHNIGFDVVDVFVHKHGGVFSLDRLALVSEIRWKGNTVLCIKPVTYMNLSGKAVKYWLDREKIDVDRLLVVVDEIALPLNRLRLRPGGSAAGHNGLKSVEESLASADYARLRFGIGNDFPRGRQVDYVLGRWREQEIPLVRLKVDISAEIIESFVGAGLERTMNQYNKLEVAL